MHLSEFPTLGRNFRSVSQGFARDPLSEIIQKFRRGGGSELPVQCIFAGREGFHGSNRELPRWVGTFDTRSELPTHTNFAGIKLWSVCSDSSDFLLVLLSTLATPYYIFASLLIVR